METLNKWFFKRMAITATYLKKKDIALEYWFKLLAIDPLNTNVMITIAHIRNQEGKRDEAIQWLKKALQSDSNNAAAWFNLGYLQQEGELHAEALQSFDRALKQHEKMDQAFYGKAISLIKLTRYEEAVEALLENTRLQPMSPYGWYQLAHTYKKMDNLDQVRKTIKKLAAFEPKVAMLAQQETGVDAGVVSPFKH